MIHDEEIIVAWKGAGMAFNVRGRRWRGEFRIIWEE